MNNSEIVELSYLPLDWLVVTGICNVRHKRVIDPTRFALVAWCRLQGDRRRAMLWQFEEKWVRIRAQLLHQPILQRN